MHYYNNPLPAPQVAVILFWVLQSFVFQKSKVKVEDKIN